MRNTWLTIALALLLLAACTTEPATTEVPARLRSIYNKSLFLLVRDTARGHDVLYFRHYDTLRVAFGNWKPDGSGWRFQPKRIRLVDTVVTQLLDQQPDSVRNVRVLLYEDSYWRARANRIRVLLLDSTDAVLTGGVTDSRGFIKFTLPVAGKFTAAAWLSQHQERLAAYDSLTHSPVGSPVDGELYTARHYPVPRGVRPDEPLRLRIVLHDSAVREVVLPSGSVRIRYYLDSQLEPMNVMEGYLKPLPDDRKLHYQLTVAQPLVPRAECHVRDMTTQTTTDQFAYE